MKKSFFIFIFTLALMIVFPSFVNAATYTVTKTADTLDGTCDADCSFREAITAANANSGHDTIEFNIPDTDAGYIPASGDTHDYWEILTGWETMTDDDGVFINGYSQPGSSRNTAPFGEPINTILKIRIYRPVNSAITLMTGDNNHITGLNIGLLRTGTSQLVVNGSSNNWFEGNFFGSNITGTEPVGGGSISHASGTDTINNTYGTNGDGVGDVGERNLFMGGSAGNNAYLSTFGSTSDGLKISGNYFGVDRTGRTCSTATIGGQTVWPHGADNFYVGTNYDGVSDSEEANIMACVNSTDRALIRIGNLDGGFVQGNFIGTNPYGDALNPDFYIRTGIVFRDTSSTNVMIRGNTIAHINGAGVQIHELSPLSSGITIKENKIFSTQSLPIEHFLSTDTVGTVNPNDEGDLDTGPNESMNHPEILYAEYQGAGNYLVWGILDAKQEEAPFTIELCKSSNHSSGHGGCLESLGSTTTTDGNWRIDVRVSGDSEYSLSSFSALATNKFGSTSEFSPNRSGQLKNAPSSVEPLGPDIEAYRSGIAANNNVLGIISENTLPWDSYLFVNKTNKLGSFRIPGTRYWQASEVYELWFKSFFNHAKILPIEFKRPVILAIKYDPFSLEPILPEKNLRLAFSDDNQVSWKVLSNSVLDITNKTVSVVTKEGGHYMLVSGY